MPSETTWESSELSELRSRAIATLRDIPGAVALYEFGSMATGTMDAWSDIDMQLQVSSVHAAISGRAEALREVGPIWLDVLEVLHRNRQSGS